MDNAAIVVKINSIEKHPNADKLQLVKLFGTQVVVGLDTKLGDILVYVDSNLKMSPEFLHNNSLFRHVEANKDNKKSGFFEDHGRVKCIKLRGEISDGFLFPLSNLDFTGKHDFKIGDEFQLVNNKPICSKYVPKVQQGSGNNNKKQAAKKREVPMFKEHFDTSQFMRNKHVIPKNTICYIEEKIHGTSHRTGLVKYPVYDDFSWWKKLIYKMFGLTKVTEWMYLNGTRRVIHRPKKKLESFHDNTMREEVLEKTKGLLLKGEELYLELFGHEKTGKEVQKGFPYGTEPGKYRSLLYRVTMNNEDGIVVDYNREAVYAKADELGFEKPYLYAKYYYNGSEPSMETLESVVIGLAQGQSNMAGDTLKEGVVIWFVNSLGKWQALKYKSDAFRERESSNKDKGIIDQENIN